MSQEFIKMPDKLLVQLSIVFLTALFSTTIFIGLSSTIAVYLMLIIFYINPILDNPKFIDGFKKHWLEILSIIPIYLASFEWTVVFVCLISVKNIVKHYIVNNNSAFNSMLILGSCLITFASISIRQFEVLPESNIKNGFDAVWWSICTITTVGYGDKFPITDGGKIIALMLMISGIGLFGTLIGYVSTYFIDKEKQNNDQIDTIEELSSQVAELRKFIEEKLDGK